MVKLGHGSSRETQDMGLAVEVDMDKVTMPVGIRLDLDELFKRWGNKVATHVRGKVRAGKQLDDDPFPPGWTLKKSGKLIRSIRYFKRYGSVMPDVRERSGVSKRARSNYGLFMILWNKAWKEHHTRLDVFDSWKRSEMLAGYLQETIDSMLREDKIKLEFAEGTKTSASDALARGVR